MEGNLAGERKSRRRIVSPLALCRSVVCNSKPKFAVGTATLFCLFSPVFNESSCVLHASLPIDTTHRSSKGIFKHTPPTKNWGKINPGILFRELSNLTKRGRGRSCGASSCVRQNSKQGESGLACMRNSSRFQSSNKPNNHIEECQGPHPGQPVNARSCQLAALPTPVLSTNATQVCCSALFLTSCVPRRGVRAARKPGQIPRKPAPRQWR